MADIINLPDPGHRAWRIFHEMLAEIARENGYCTEDIEAALEELKPLFLEAYQFMEGPEKPPSSADEWASWIKLTNEWVKGFAIRVLGLALLAKLQLRAATISPGGGPSN